jgi:hypothetical protein
VRRLLHDRFYCSHRREYFLRADPPPSAPSAKINTMSRTGTVRVLAAVECSDGRVELFDDGKSIGLYTRLDNRTARLARAAKELTAADLAVAAAIARSVKRGKAALTDRQIALAAQVSLPTAFRARYRLRAQGWISWVRAQRGNRYRMQG